jgi:non-heme chloroperoxidase
MEHHRITGGGGIQLHVVETGKPDGRPILFIHGFSQCWLAWGRQMRSDLADDFRLVAMDIRGHGLSDKPREGYAQSRLWADDVHAVIQTLRLNHPILCGWSYGPLVILDYIRHYSEEEIGGVNLIGGVTKLGSEEAASVMTQEFLALLPGCISTDAEESVRGLVSLLRLCFVQEPSTEELYPMLGWNVSVPPYVRQGMFTRSFDNDDLLPRMRKPVLITHGGKDAVVKLSAVEQHKAPLPHAQLHIMDNAGHTPFWEDAAVYNQRLRAFAAGL